MRNRNVKVLVSIMIFLILIGTPYLHEGTIYAEGENLGEGDCPELLVKYRSPHSMEIRSPARVNVLKDVESVEVIAPQVELITLTEDADKEAVKTRLENDPNVELVEPNFERQVHGEVDDPYFSRQWWIPHVKAESFWMYTSFQKRNVVVAMIDTGIDVEHEDLKNRIATGGYNFFSNNTIVTDFHGHGTYVSGVVAAQLGNGRGIAGIAGVYDISVLPLKVSHTGQMYVSDLIKAIDYAVEKEVAVINMSLGGPTFSALENEAIQRAIQAGIVVVASAGNEAQKGNWMNYPASYDNVISVGAVNEQNEHSAFSNYNHSVNLVAPGERIYTTSPNDSYVAVDGTSFSAPIVAGTVAMMKAIEPDLSISEIDELLKTTASDLGAPGPDTFYGAGVLDIGKLIEQLTSLKNPSEGFIGDFPELTVLDSKVFTVTFNQELNYGKDYREDILITRQVNGEAPVTSFTVEVDPANPFRLLIAPRTKWEIGDHYLTITSGLQNNNGKVLSKAVRMKFEVEDQLVGSY